MKTAQRSDGGHWSGGTRTGLMAAAVRDWNVSPSDGVQLITSFRTYYGHTSIESHPEPRSGSRDRVPEGTLLRLDSRPIDRTQPRAFAFFACHLASLAVSRIIGWTECEYEAQSSAVTDAGVAPDGGGDSTLA